MEDNTPVIQNEQTQDALPSVRDYSMSMAIRDCIHLKRMRYVQIQLVIGILSLSLYTFLELSGSETLSFVAIAQGVFLLKVIGDIYEQYKFTRGERHLAILKHATMDVQDDALIPDMTFTQIVRARMGFVWRENKVRMGIVGVMISVLSVVIVSFFGGPALMALGVMVFLLIILIVAMMVMVLWEVVFPPTKTRKQLDAEILLARKKMAYDDLQGALSSPGTDTQTRGALSEANQTTGGLTPME